ncbi:hypothetical protein Dda3937_03121 [Dickeya dadantii 3937]|uniref:Uncharacterized protein n=1 Tax=Dickeya dadantii (strain 3937) TaxID=198628 RepID=E0SFY7_DICD3|nr:hypothetical protein Dda3937_03121 [Dickeya dadantii 3937]
MIDGINRRRVARTKSRIHGIALDDDRLSLVNVLANHSGNNYHLLLFVGNIICRMLKCNRAVIPYGGLCEDNRNVIAIHSVMAIDR